MIKVSVFYPNGLTQNSTWNTIARGIFRWFRGCVVWH